MSGPLPVRPSGIFISATRTARRAGAAALRPVLNPMVRLTARYKGIAATRLRVGSFDVREVGAARLSPSDVPPRCFGEG